eukprot:2146059-Rhodomonas_salina.1
MGDCWVRSTRVHPRLPCSLHTFSFIRQRNCALHKFVDAIRGSESEAVKKRIICLNAFESFRDNGSLNPSMDTGVMKTSERVLKKEESISDQPVQQTAELAWRQGGEDYSPVAARDKDVEDDSKASYSPVLNPGEVTRVGTWRPHAMFLLEVVACIGQHQASDQLHDDLPSHRSDLRRPRSRILPCSESTDLRESELKNDFDDELDVSDILR